MMKKINGFSLIEASIALGISAIVIGGVVSILNVTSRGNAQYNLVQARNEIVNKIRMQSHNPKNLYSSANITQSLGAAGLEPDYGPVSSLSHPNLLQNCMPDPANRSNYGCDKTTLEEVGRGFLFYLTENADKSPEKTVAGEDVYYRNTGARCTSLEAANADLCPIMARVWFEPFCLNFANSCNKAMSLVIRYSVGLRSDFTSDITLSDLNGELYVPLQKGIFIRNLLSQNNSPILPNSKGIFVIPKFYGFPNQIIEGLRFETSVTNASGLNSMRVQVRSLTGVNAKLHDDSKIPPNLLTQTWLDVPTPENPGLGAWSIDLTGATPNQTFNFGTQINSENDSRSPVSFMIGKAKNGNPDPKFHWTVNADSTEYLPPAFQSGFYQFRIVTKDITGSEIESSNYATVRLIPTPELQFVNSSFILFRDCINTKTSFSLFIADDEQITFNEIKLNGSIIPTSPVVGNKGFLNFDFSINQNANNYPLVVTLKNAFSDIKMESLTVPKLEDPHIINLSEVSIGSSLTSTPDKIRISGSGTAALSYKTGNCCNAIPKVTWSFLSSPFFGGVPLLAESGTNSYSDVQTNMTCNTLNNTRSCHTSISVKGMKESPTLSSPPDDISAKFDLGTASNNPACYFSSTNPSGDPVSKYIPVVNLPTIRFYLAESLWLHNIPAGPATTSLLPTAIRPTIPRVYVRIDFAPLNDIELYVVDSLNPSTILCPPITFLADGSIGPIDKFCDINNINFSGTLELRRKDNNPLTPLNKIMYEGESLCPFSACDAKFAGTTRHAICQRSFTNPTMTSEENVPMPPKLIIPTTLAMTDSPFGLTTNGSQHVKNDFNLWQAGREKRLRCYDNWSKNNNPNHNFNDPFNNQDYYPLYKYNSETIIGLNPQPATRHYRIENLTSGSNYSLQFQTYNYPTNNGSLDYASANVPYIYMVSQSGTPKPLRWEVPMNSSASGIMYSGIQPWEDVTSGLNCNGLSNNLKLYRIRPNVNWNTSTATVRSVTSALTVLPDYSDRYSYLFLCSYGRWNPTHPNNTTWTD